jgi:YbbR domain-containing protein
VKENNSYKIVALLITLILWVIILGSKEAVTMKSVHIDYILPKNMRLTDGNNITHEVFFKAAGPRLILKKFVELNEPLVIDLSHVEEGTTTVRIHADSINTPPGVRILSMSPTTVTVKLEKAAP